jgi:alkylation response protein AidB-like acyl-CoA dehydrogenase
VGIARYARCDALLAKLRSAMGEEWDSLPGVLRARWVRAAIDIRVARLLAYAAVARQEQDGPDDASASIARIAATSCDQSVAEVLMDAAGPAGLEGGRDAVLHGAIDDHWRYAQAATVASGTIEVQRMLVARSVLGGRG